jgi:hypothetical protein
MSSQKFGERAGTLVSAIALIVSVISLYISWQSSQADAEAVTIRVQYNPNCQLRYVKGGDGLEYCYGIALYNLSNKDIDVVNVEAQPLTNEHITYSRFSKGATDLRLPFDIRLRSHYTFGMRVGIFQDAPFIRHLQQFKQEHPNATNMAEVRKYFVEHFQTDEFGEDRPVDSGVAIMSKTLMMGVCVVTSFSRTFC